MNAGDRHVPRLPDVIAPDGSEVRILCQGERASMAHFTLKPGQVSQAVAHRTVEEVWYVLSGTGRMWRKLDEAEAVVTLCAGLSLRIPPRAGFQFRADGTEPLAVIGVTMPPWPGQDEAYPVQGIWQPNIRPEPR